MVSLEFYLQVHYCVLSMALLVDSVLLIQAVLLVQRRQVLSLLVWV